MLSRSSALLSSSSTRPPLILLLFFFNDTATTEIYTLSLHDALPICRIKICWPRPPSTPCARRTTPATSSHCERHCRKRSEEHTSELQSLAYLVCRLLLEKKKNINQCYHMKSLSVISILPFM